MKPSDYRDYAACIDFFSNPYLTDSFGLVDILAEHLPRGASVADVGGGTGLVAEMLLEEREDLTITLVEPSPEMAERAEARLEPPHRVIRGTLEDALPELDEVTAFLFNRSLYALHGEAEEYADLMSLLAAKLAPGGYLAILEVGQKYDVDANKQRLDSVPDDVPGWDAASYARGWPILRKAMETFNDGVDAGTFTLFEEGDIEALAEAAGFRDVHAEFPVYLYQLPKRRRWFGFGR